MILSAEQLNFRKQVARFAEDEAAPLANEWDKQGSIPENVIQKLAEKGYLGATVPGAYGGLELDQLSYGILNEEIGKGCSSLRSLITVHSSLVSETILRWGTKEQKDYLLPLLSAGKKIAAFCLSEPDTGSDAKNVNTLYNEDGDHFIIHGTKKWTTFGQRADIFLVICRNESEISAFLIDRNTPGIEIIPINGMMGTRASMLAEIHFKGCRIPKENLLGKRGFGFLQIVNTALDNGRYSVACGSLGIARACLEESIKYAKSRKQFGVPIANHQLIKQKISNMITETKAARLLCYNAGYLRTIKSPNAIIQTNVAKYFTSSAACRIAAEAVQLHGAIGFDESFSIQRYFRDARVMEVIEGSSEIQQILIADHGLTSLESILES